MSSDGDRQTGRQALDDDDQGLAVGLAGGQEAEHGANLLGRRPRGSGTGREPGRWNDGPWASR